MPPKLKVKSFLDYLDKSNVISAGVGFTTGLAINDFFTKVIDELVINQVKHQVGGGVDGLKIELGGGAKIQYGAMLLSGVKLALVLIVSYIILRMADRFLGLS